MAQYDESLSVHSVHCRLPTVHQKVMMNRRPWANSNSSCRPVCVCVWWSHESHKRWWRRRNESQRANFPFLLLSFASVPPSVRPFVRWSVGLFSHADADGPKPPAAEYWIRNAQHRNANSATVDGAVDERIILTLMKGMKKTTSTTTTTLKTGSSWWCACPRRSFSLNLISFLWWPHKHVISSLPSLTTVSIQMLFNRIFHSIHYFATWNRFASLLLDHH